MIFVGNQRGGARDLAIHLMKPENDRVEVHELRGFVAEDLHGALQESYALSRATQCRQHLFSLSLNPPPGETVETAVFDNVIARAEKRLGLEGQPRAIVFHEKDGRRHAHAVWSRIDAEAGKAVQLSFTQTRLQALSREIYLERGWRMPEGFVDKTRADPQTFTLAEWQQAKRAEKDPKALKRLFQDAWAISDSRPSFGHALEERGFVLARGDRRGFLAVDHTGEAYAVSRWVGVKARQVRERLGGLDDLPSVEQAHAQAARKITRRLEDIRREQAEAYRRERARLAADARHASEQHRRDAQALTAAQARRSASEARDRDARHRRGLLGLWDRLTGKRKAIARENALMASAAAVRDKKEQDRLLSEQNQAKKVLQREMAATRSRQRGIAEELSKDIADLRQAEDKARALPRPSPGADRVQARRPRRARRAREGPDRDR